MTTSRDVLASSPDICPGQISWDYDRAEIIADGVVHAIGVCLGLIGAVTIVVMAVKIERINVAPILVYVIKSSDEPHQRAVKERELSRDSCDCSRSRVATPRRRVSKLTNAHHPGERWCAGALEHLYAGRPRDCDV